jgi:hypothetical protein
MILAIEHWEKNQDLDLSSTHRIINYIREDGSKEDDRISDKITNFTKASFVFIGLIRTGIDKCNTKIMIDTIRDPDLFRVEN